VEFVDPVVRKELVCVFSTKLLVCVFATYPVTTDAVNVFRLLTELFKLAVAVFKLFIDVLTDDV
jgi:hypothetical protein